MPNCLFPISAGGVCCARVLGREISCEIALKKGAKREGNGRDQQQQQQGGGGGAQTPRPERSATSKEATASSYGGGPAVGTKRPGVIPAPAAASSGKEAEPAKGAADVGKAAAAAAEEGGTPKVSRREDQLRTAIEAAEATGLGKKEARKFARKAMKKELKRKAKERAKEKKEAQASLDAAAAEAAPPASSTTAEDAGGEAEEGEGEPVDPKAAKLLVDAKTLLIFGVADDLTAKQLQKRVKKVRTGARESWGMRVQI